MTRQSILAHIQMMAQHDPSYAQKALKWYRQVLPWLDLPESLP